MFLLQNSTIHRFPSCSRISIKCILPCSKTHLYLEKVRTLHRGIPQRDNWDPWENHVVNKRRLPSWEKKTSGLVYNFPDWIEKWSRKAFYRVGVGLAVTSLIVGFHLGPYHLTTWVVGTLVVGYWALGIHDIRSPYHTIPRNFPVLGNIRYFFESIRPEIRQYFIEGDAESLPFSRNNRSVVYQRAKGLIDTQPLGTRHDVYASGYEWANHSIWPTTVIPDNRRVTIGGPDCLQPYSASLLNVSAMSYGALSDNAILALNTAASMGHFYHNTGEGGVSRFHLRPGGDIVWNIGTGYFGCRTSDGKFDPVAFAKNAAKPNIKMIELKLSQGAKPGHGGILPKSKVTPEIAEARGVLLGVDCVSPSNHSAFKGPQGMIEFIGQLRQLSGGKPIGIKLCIGFHSEFASLVVAMLKTGITPDFITVDGGEGGTGAAPPEYSNHLGTPLVEGLTFVHNILLATGLRDRVKVIGAGKVIGGFSIVRMIALGADVCNAARAMMFALGCIQALKCNTNKCPSGVATQDKELMKGLVVEDKAARVLSYHKKSIESALDIIGSMGLESPSLLTRMHIIRRVSQSKVLSYEQLYPTTPAGCLVKDFDNTPPHLKRIWIEGEKIYEDSLIDASREGKYEASNLF